MSQTVRIEGRVSHLDNKVKILKNVIFCPQNCHSNSLSRYELPGRYFLRRLVVTAVSQFVRGGRCLSPYYILSQIYDYDGGGEDDRSL